MGTIVLGAVAVNVRVLAMSAAAAGILFILFEEFSVVIVNSTKKK